MSEIEELRARVEALEEELARVREDQAATRTLAAMSDRDVAEFRHVQRGQTGLLNALQETQSSHTSQLADLQRNVGSLSTDVTNGFAATQVLLQTIIDRLPDDA